MGFAITALHLLLLLLLFTEGIPVAEEAAAPFACSSSDASTPALGFCRPSLSIPERVGDLIGRLTLPEKVGLLRDNAAAVPRLGIQGYEWWSEALHGVSNVGPGTTFGAAFPGATSFPQVITTAASFNSSLWQAIGRVVSDEARAMYNGRAAGLTFWSPNVNIFRDPRWGRGQETPGEDPIVAGRYAAWYVRGLQGDDENRLKVAACCKHFTAYDLDNWNGVDRFHFNALVSKQDREDTFDVPFRACVREGKVASVMCSYNQVNGVPTCADPNLLRRTIRDKWKLNGYIVSDCDSVGVFYNSQHYTSTPEEAVADAIKAGLDLDCGPFLADHTLDAIKKGVLREEDVNAALANTIAVQMRLGLFDGDPSAQLFSSLGPADVCTPDHQQLALEAARQGIVLLKNLDATLPLSAPTHRTIAVIGPNSNATVTMIGNYAGIACGYSSPLVGLGRYTTAVHQPGCADVACADDTLFAGAIGAASRADATVMVMGLDQSIEAETVDRAGLLLPGRQQDLVSRVAAASKGPTILVLLSGGPIDVTFADRNPRVSAILWAGYPGQAGGTAIADVVFGTTNPGGRLPMTWYPQEYLAKVPMTTMSMRPDPRSEYPGRTYRFYKGPVLYSFGYGLSYTNFIHTIAGAPAAVAVPLRGHRVNGTVATFGKMVRVTHARCDGLSITVQVDVRNAGAADGTHTVMVYSSPPLGGHWTPQKQLVAFEKVSVPAGGRRSVNLGIHVCKYLSTVDRSGVRRIAMGEHSLHVGDLEHRLTLQPLKLGEIRV